MINIKTNYIDSYSSLLLKLKLHYLRHIFYFKFKYLINKVKIDIIRPWKNGDSRDQLIQHGIEILDKNS